MSRSPQAASFSLPFGGRTGRRELFRHLRQRILDGGLPAGERLLSTRDAAKERGLSRTTVEEIYEELAAEGLIVRQKGRGSFVSDLIVVPQPVRESHSLRASRRGTVLGGDARGREDTKVTAFNAGVPDGTLFPFKAWERCRRRAVRDLDAELFNHTDAQGFAPLREQLARHLSQFRGLSVEGRQIVVFPSTSMAMNALMLLLADPGDGIYVEDPGYAVVHAAARLNGLIPVRIGVDAQGVRVDEIVTSDVDARLAYVTPAHHYPTGAPLTHERRVALLTWANERDAVIIEDDYDADFQYRGRPLPTLHGLDQGRRVVYLGTLSKATFQGLRIAYAVLPSALVEPVVNIRTQLDGFVPIETQATLANFIAEGRLVSHIRASRKVYGRKQQYLLDALAPLLAEGWTTGPIDAGLHFVLYEPSPGLAQKAAQHATLRLSTLSSYGERAPVRDGLVIRFGGLDLPTIQTGGEELVRHVLSL